MKPLHLALENGQSQAQVEEAHGPLQPWTTTAVESLLVDRHDIGLAFLDAAWNSKQSTCPAPSSSS